MASVSSLFSPAWPTRWVERNTSLWTGSRSVVRRVNHNKLQTGLGRKQNIAFSSLWALHMTDKCSILARKYIKKHLVGR